MQAYDDARDDAVLWGLAEDAFACSRAAFDALTATLASAEAGGWTHDQLEGHLRPMAGSCCDCCSKGCGSSAGTA